MILDIGPSQPSRKEIFEFPINHFFLVPYYDSDTYRLNTKKQSFMRNSIFGWMCCICLSIPFLTNAQVFDEDFESGIPGGWVQFTEAGFDFISWFEGEVNMFKQSDGDEILMFGTDLLDLSLFTKWEVDLYAFNLNFNSDTKPFLEMGVMTDPNDEESFVPIVVHHVTNESPLTFSVFLGAYESMGHLVLKMVGEKSQITYVDNWKIYDEVFEANFPLAVENLTLTSAPDGELLMLVDWTNPIKEADGDPLINLDAIEFYVEDILVATQSNPVIGATESIEIPVDSSNYYSVTAIAVSNGINGYERESNVEWIGLDYPAAVQNLNLELEQDYATLTWEPPTEGGNGGYFDGEITEYIITRCDGQIITVPGDENSFNEYLNLLGTINYTVAARNNSDIGDPSLSNDIFYVSQDFIYYEDFWVDVVQSTNETPAMGLNQWQSESTTNFADWGYFTSNFTDTDPGEISYLWSSNNQSNQIVRLVSPVMNTIGSENITVEMKSYLEASNSEFSFFLESSSDNGENWNEIHQWLVDGTPIDEVTKKVIANDDVGSENFRLAITLKGNPATPGFVRFDNIRVYDQPSVDIKVSQFDDFPTVSPNSEVSISAEIENNSTMMVDCSVECIVRERFGSNDTMYMNEIEVTSMTIAEQRILDFGNWNAEEGEYEVEISIHYPGGDDNPNNDKSTEELNVLNTIPRELVLMEDFTGTWCSYCPGAALGITELKDQNYPIVAIGRHRDDDYETMDVVERMEQYGVLGFPTMMIDGVTKITGGHQTQSVAHLYIDDINARINTPSVVDIDVIESKLEGVSFNSMVRITSPSLMLNPNFELRASIIESHIEDEWLNIPTVDETQRYYSDHLIDLSESLDIVHLSFSLDEVLNLDNAELVLYVQDISNNQVLNATVIDVNAEITKVEETKSKLSFWLKPKPCRRSSYLGFTKYGY